jgi:hypothetical protein
MSKREPKDVWKALVKEAEDDEADFQQAAGATREQVDASLAAQGLDPKAERAAVGDWRREIEQRVALRKATATEQRASTRPRGRPRPILVLLAATVGAAATGGLIYALARPAPPVPAAPAPAPSIPEPSPVESVAPDPLVAAATLRKNAFADCDAFQWQGCLHYLDQARELDPAGDAAPEVKKARDRASWAIAHPKGN